MKKVLIIIVTFFFVLTTSINSYALFGAGDIVYDPAAVAKLIEQIKQFEDMIEKFKKLNKYAEKLKDFAELDHEMLASQHFQQFLSEYERQFDAILNEIEGYQGGGLMGKIGDLEGRYPGYHTDWEFQDNENDEFYDNLPPELAPVIRSTKKQILLTKIQMKHALKVGAQVRESVKAAEEQTKILLQDNKEAAGLMVSLGVGNELTGMVAKSVQSLNVQLNEYLQAYSGAELEKNQRKGDLANRAREAYQGFKEPKQSEKPVKLNPFGDR